MHNIQTTINVVDALHHCSWCIRKVIIKMGGVVLFLKYAMCLDFGWSPTDWNKENVYMRVGSLN